MFDIGYMFNYVDTHVFQVMGNKKCQEMNINMKFKIPCIPVLTQWWTIGVCALDLIKCWKIWYQFLNNMSKLPTSDITPATINIMKGTRYLISIPELNWDISFFVEIQENSIFHHFYFLKRGDLILKHKYGYQNYLIKMNKIFYGY